MKKTITRRMTLATLSSLALMGAGSTLVQAQTAYPSQPIKFIVPYPAGGTTDVLARMVAQKMQESWQQTVVVENKPGAGGTIGNNLVAKAPADGYTVLFGIVALVQQMTLMKLPYDPIKDFAPISRVAITPAVFAASTTLPVNNLAELIKLVKANPGKYSFGTYGPGTSAHLQGELLNLQTGIDLLHIPYQGAAPLVTAMLGGQLSTAFMDAGSSRQHIPKFKVLGVTGSERLSWLPNVPTFKEQGLNSFEPMGWVGLLLPGATPKPVVDKFSAETQRILKLPDVREKIEAMGLIPGGETSDSFGKVMKSDADIYARIIRDAKITLN
ncbi:tripartite tricarboxylate transporter substrate binding protein [Limnohabitans sp. 2KL-51]|jgi:tripartite-type tricarboxylate transporter receptor subunit TctC|uniref:Bug family tripartite tricarboxylate transporter substrate binding protein n=1 Tax=Limnohabitans sp. 2KL-51 TaxID=1977911 RepID=UPI000D387425|nr:tripartite tricarboxylate transporter substrate binding protein [Limnohabitans sp. 2KL-51]PUE44837.1 ABC transporter substrate-binding protein [Limnohabitans sp. 2KL-51]